MDSVLDFSDYPKTNTYYGGSEKKISVLVNGSEYMLKFQKADSFGNKRDNHVSEYIGSHIFEILGFPVQETHLGIYRGEPVVACKNFLESGEQFVPFNDVGESTLDRDRETYQYSYDDIMKMLVDNSKLTNVAESIEMFWDLYVVDAILGNFDRHGANWGFVKRHGAYRLAPVFDNGSCLFPRLTDEDEMESVMASDVETNRRVFEFPTSQILLDGKKSSYFEVISSLRYEECNKALAAIHDRYDKEQVDQLLECTPMISETKRRFLGHMLDARYRLIVESSFSKLQEKAR